MSKISVIIPVFNAEKHIEECCRSLFGQTMKDIEYIFIDDYSSDRSMEIVQEVLRFYPERERAVKIISHTENMRVSASRQDGLDAATGDFVIHCDSDDWVDKTAYESMYNVALKEKCDIVCCGFYIECPDKIRRIVQYESKDYYNTIAFNIAPKTGSLCNKLVRRAILVDESVNFPLNINWGEDFCVSIEGLLLSRKTLCLRECYYHYRQNLSSITHSITLAKCDELILVAGVVEAFLREKGLLAEYVNELNYLKFQVKLPLLLRPEVRDLRLWSIVYPECHKSILKYNVSRYIRIVGYLAAKKQYVLAGGILSLRDRLKKRK